MTLPFGKNLQHMAKHLFYRHSTNSQQRVRRLPNIKSSLARTEYKHLQGSIITPFFANITQYSRDRSSMSVNLTVASKRTNSDHSHLVGLVFIGLSVFAALMILVINSDLSTSFPYFFLFPWILLLLFVLGIPAAVLLCQGKFNLANPIIFAAWSYFFPAFVLGGIALAVGWSQPYFLSYIQD